MNFSVCPFFLLYTEQQVTQIADEALVSQNFKVNLHAAQQQHTT